MIMQDGQLKSVSTFTKDERAALHAVAEIFSDKGDREELRNLISQGATLQEIILAYRTQKRMVSTLKAFAGVIAVVAGTAGALKSIGFWPK